VVGERTVPRHLFFSRNWQVKQADLVSPGQIAEELAYIEENPYAELLREVCRIARIGYGRIDYALLDGRPQIWEINALDQKEVGILKNAGFLWFSASPGSHTLEMRGPAISL
jgi:hypothetical protein